MRVLTIVAALFAVFSFSACNTIQGFGKDLQSGGEAIQRQAD